MPKIPPVLLPVVLVALVCIPHAFLFRISDWELVYVPAAKRLQSQESIYRDAFVYPPFAALIAVPTTHLPPPLWRIQFWLMNLLGGCGLLVVGWRLTGGRFHWLPPRRELAIAALGLAAGFGFVLDSLVNRQTDLLLAGGIVAGCWLLLNGRPHGGAILIGLAAAVKGPPLLFVPYFLLVGNRRAALVVAVVALGGNMLPDMLYPPPTGTPRVREWIETVLAPKFDPNGLPGDWYSGIGFNHSLSGIVNRRGTAELVERDGEWIAVPRANPAPAWLLKSIVALVGAVLAFGAARIIRRERAITPRGIGSILCLMLLLSPMSSKPHFCALIIPAWILARAALERDRRLWIPTIAAAILGLLPNKDLLGGYAYDWWMWYGAIPMEVLVLFAGLSFTRANEPDA